MSKLTVCVCAVVMAASSVFAEANPPVKRHGPPPRRQNGGFLIKEMPKTVICLRDNQKSFTASEVAAAVSEFQNNVFYGIVRVEGDRTVANAPVIVVLKEKLESGRKVLVAPQDGWAEVGVDWLLADSPSPETRARRLYLALVRAVGAAMGVGISMYQPCIMSDVREAKDLDKISANLKKPGPEGLNNIEVCAKRYGLERIRRYSYRQACMQGWAPSPTNDIQKAIWDEVHELPTKPIKIEFDPKKGN